MAKAPYNLREMRLREADELDRQAAGFEKARLFDVARNLRSRAEALRQD